MPSGRAALDHGGEGVVDVLQVGQQDLGGHPDQRAGQAVEHAVDAGGGAGDLGHGLAAGGEHPLPDVLADQDAEEVDQEVGDDGVPADGVEAEGGRRQLGHQGVPAAGVVDRQRHQQEHQADGHDQELHDVGQGQRPHAADGGVEHHDAAAEQDGDPERQAEQDLHDGADGDGRGGADHQRVGQHDQGAGLAGRRVVATLQDLGDGVDAQLQQRLGQEQVQRDDAEAQRAAQPEAGDAVDVAQAHRADGGGAAEDGGGHGAQVEAGAEVAAGHQVVVVGLGAAHAVPAQPHHARGVDQNDDQI